MSRRYRIVVAGVGRIGAVTAVGLAHLDHDVVGIDRSESRVTELARSEIREAEPGLRAAIRNANRFRKIAFAASAEPGLADIAFLCVDTPASPGGEADLSQVFAAARDAARLLRPDGILITRSTVPVGTGDRLAKLLAGTGRGDIHVVHVPEFLREGRAWEDFRTPDRIVVGGEFQPAIATVTGIFEPLGCPIYVTNRRTAELAKYAANAFLATSISFANEIAGLCDDLGVDSPAVFEVLRADRRIGPDAYLTPGLGFGGHCLPKDTAALEHLAQLSGRHLEQLAATRSVNRRRIGSAASWLARELEGLDGRKVAILGLAFKPGTEDLRDSLSLSLASTLRAQGATVSGWDPHVRSSIPGIDVRASIDTAVTGCDAIVVAHAWPGWQDLRPGHLKRLMRRHVVYDAPATLDAQEWHATGFVINRVPHQMRLLIPEAPLVTS